MVLLKNARSNETRNNGKRKEREKWAFNRKNDLSFPACQTGEPDSQEWRNRVDNFDNVDNVDNF